MPSNPSPLTAALFRSLLGATLSAAMVFFSLIGTTSLGTREIIAAVGTAFFGYIVARGGIEGFYDQRAKPLQNQPPANELDGSQ